MAEDAIEKTAELDRAFAAYNKQVILNSIQIGCLLGILLMPAGVLLDSFVYPKEVGRFLALRLLCSLLIGVFGLIVRRPIGQRYYQSLGVTLAMFPTLFISLMIYLKGGAESPYYAGLNLVLLVIGFVLRWTFAESAVAVTLVLMMYLAACLLPEGPVTNRGILVNNVYFLMLTGVIVMAGSYFHTRLRRREFMLRFELDKNRQQLEQNNQKLLELGQVKDRFFANISHELRTPLTLLISPLEILLFQKGRLLNEEQKSLAQMMHANAMRLLKMINDLLDLVRLESGRMEVKPEPVEVREFVKSLNNATRQVAQDKQLQLHMNVAAELTSVLVDRDKLEKICLNLLFNAIKFTPAGGMVELAAKKEENQLVITVRDSGVGISSKNLPFVFDRFWQADNSSKRKFKGVGIGLSLVKELAEVQGGKASVESDEGKGTTFTVRLPFVSAETALLLLDKGTDGSETENQSRAGTDSEEWLTNLYRRAELFSTTAPRLSNVQGPGHAETPSLADNGDKPTVVIADDEPGMVNFLRSQVQQHFRIIEAADGREAVEKVTVHLPDIVLLDMNMPEKDGLQVCRELRENPSTEKIPIVLLTARADEETKLAALSAGANDFLPKPFSVAELHVRLKNLVQSHDYQQKLNQQNQTLAQTIEQLKQTESQLVQTAKMASLGRMSAGIIHEINNPLNFATTGLYTLRTRGKLLPVDEQSEYAEIIRDIEDGLRRVHNIVTDLRTFTHPDTGDLDEVNVADAIASVLRFLSNEWRGQVQIDVTVPKEQTVRANKNRLVQVLLNLLQNSIDAMKKKAFVNEAPTVWVTGWVSGGVSVITVRDNGEGIEPQHLDKIFDPFFTTKDVGDGMGLGLSICYRLVREHGGQIRVNSERGKFTEFALEFPASKLN